VNETDAQNLSRKDNPGPEPSAREPSIVDVVIPVYSGFEDTRLCIESVLAHPQITPFELVVVNDSSPEPEISAYLQSLSDTSVTLLTNEANIGFVDSANLGMMLHPGRDVVLLNSDTLVSGDWLDRLKRAADSDPEVATVTPFSNNATLASYPRYMNTNPLPEGWAADALDSLFLEMNRGNYVEIPTAVGFCTYITRRSLDRVGYFDSLHFGQGYGEENDFSMRAAAAGFKHLLAGDTFVFHKGGASFGGQAAERSEKAQETLRRLHPGYEPLVQQHCSVDPERPLRRRVDIARLAGSARRRLLFISHRLGGGTEKHLRDLALMLEPDWEVLVLRPTGPEDVSLEWARSGEEFAAFFHLPEDYQDLLGFLMSLNVARVHIHHTVELAPPVLDLLGDLGVPYDFTVHDYYSICPFTNLITATGEYCGEPSLAGCDLCFATRRPPGEADARTRRHFYAGLLNGAARVIAPSRDALERMGRYFPEAALVHLPHPEAEVAPSVERRPEPSAESSPLTETASVGGGEIKVLVLGEMSPAKGLWLLEACASDAAERGLPLFFRVLGRPLASVGQEPELPLSFSGPYDDSQIMRLLSTERPHIIFFPARWPETFSYTLSAAMHTGLPIAAPRLGSFPERLEDYPAANIMETETAAEAWNALFTSLAHGSGGSGHES
jgi:GT2 family glycosyltransferase